MQELVKKIAEVADAVAFQAGVGGMEIAGQIVSCLAAKPELIDRFMEEGSGMLIDGTLSAENGLLTFQNMAGGISSPQDLRIAKQVQALEKQTTR